MTVTRVDERNRSILDSAHEAFVSMDASGVITDWNPQAARTFGWSREEALGAALADLIVPPEHREAHWRGLSHFLTTGEGPVLNKRIEITGLHRDGHEFPIELTISPMRSEDEWVFNAFLHDISERRRAEEETALAQELALAIAEAETIDDALTATLRAICERSNWQFAEAWVPTPDGAGLQCNGACYVASEEFEPFRQGTQTTALEPGVGLVARAWSSGESVWMTDVTSDPDFPRASLAAKVGLAAAMTVPVLAGEEPLAVLVFFASAPREEDRRLLDLVSTVTAGLSQAMRRRQAESILRRSQFQLAYSQKVARTGSWEWDVATHEMSWSDELYRIFGADGQDRIATYERFLERVHPDDRELVHSRIREALDDGKPFDFHHRIALPDGTIRALHSQGEVLAGDSGEPVRVFGTAHDVTDQKRLEEESTGFWHLSPDLLGIVGFDGELKRVNPAHERVLGYAERELVGRAYIELIHPEDRDRVADQTAKLTSSPKEIRSFEARARCKDGSYRSLRASAKANPDESLIYTVAVDVTERRKTEEEIALARELALAIGAAENVEAALALALRSICTRTGWKMGQAWVQSPDGSCLECSPAWYSSSEGLEPFRERSESMTFWPDEGLPGRVWTSGEAIWIKDLNADPNFPRSPFAREVGLRAGMAVPVVAGDEIPAVLEFFISEPREEDERLVGIVSTVAAQLGSLIIRKRIEEDRRKSEERFRLLVEGVQDYAIFMLNDEGDVASWNQGAERITGYRADEIVGYHVSRFFPAQEVEQGEPLRELEIAKRDGRFEKEGWRLRKDGLQFRARIVMTALRGEAGNLRGFSKVIHDVTVQRQAADELERLGAIIESTSDAIISTTPKGIITSWNPGAQRLLGYSAREVVGRSVNMLAPPGQRGEGGEALEQVLALERVLGGKKVDHYETQRLTKDGSLIDVSMTVSPIRNSAETIVGTSFIARDITDRKRTHQYLEKAFGTYLDRDVANHILKEGRLGAGEKVEVTMIFVDIRDFTNLAARYEPDEVVETLNCLFELAVPIITQHGGHVDKFVGDGLLAVFGTPQRLGDHADRAVEAALEIDRAAREQFEGDLEIGIGVHSGTVVAGNVGGGGRLDFTVIGDAVNIAARVEAATRETDDTVLITEQTKRQLQRCQVPLHERHPVQLKGKGEPVVLYSPSDAAPVKDRLSA